MPRTLYPLIVAVVVMVVGVVVTVPVPVVVVVVGVSSVKSRSGSRARARARARSRARARATGTYPNETNGLSCLGEYNEGVAGHGNSDDANWNAASAERASASDRAIGR